MYSQTHRRLFAVIGALLSLVLGMSAALKIAASSASVTASYAHELNFYADFGILAVIVFTTVIAVVVAIDRHNWNTKL
jgi:hypothetical protein